MSLSPSLIAFLPSANILPTDGIPHHEVCVHEMGIGDGVFELLQTNLTTRHMISEGREGEGRGTLTVLEEYFGKLRLKKQV
jgi:hypothetical protein